MHRRFDAGPLLAAAGAALLALALFLSWFEVDLNAWEAFEALDLVLAGLAAGIIFLALRQTPDGRLLVGLAAAALLIVVVQLVDPPPAVAGAGRELGIWLALAGAALALVGAMLVLAAISVHVDVRGREHRRREAAVDRREGAGGRGTARSGMARSGSMGAGGGTGGGGGGGAGAGGGDAGAPRGGEAAGSVALEDTAEVDARERRSLFARRDPEATQTFAPLPDDDDPTTVR
jgi:uncharacterized membrane protein YgcG